MIWVLLHCLWRGLLYLVVVVFGLVFLGGILYGVANIWWEYGQVVGGGLASVILGIFAFVIMMWHRDRELGVRILIARLYRIGFVVMVLTNTLRWYLLEY